MYLNRKKYLFDYFYSNNLQVDAAAPTLGVENVVQAVLGGSNQNGIP